jgi:hypothetical protein
MHKMCALEITLIRGCARSLGRLSGSVCPTRDSQEVVKPTGCNHIAAAVQPFVAGRRSLLCTAGGQPLNKKPIT